MKNLDITSFENVLSSLNSILIRYEKDNHDIDIRDAVIQRFEYTYSLALKMLNRFLNMQAPQALPDMTFNEIIRNANKLGLLKSNLEKWTEFRQKRNSTLPYEVDVIDLNNITDKFKQHIINDLVDI